MKRYLIAPLAATLLLAGAAVSPLSFADDATTTPAPAADKDHAGHDGHWHHDHGMWHHMDPLAKLTKPMTADQVKDALEASFARRPHVQSVTEKGPDILLVEIADPDGKIHRFELNRTTGARRPAW